MVKTHSKKILIFILIFVLTITALAACDPGGDINQILNSLMPDNSNEGPGNESSGGTSNTPDGYTAAPEVYTVINIEPKVVLIAGTCENGSAVTIRKGKNEVTVDSVNGYFIAEVEIDTDSTAVMEAVAKVENKEESKVHTFEASYNATAEKRIDGNAVSVGNASKLFFDVALDRYLGKSLLTQTQITSFKTNVNAKVTNFQYRAGHGIDVSLVYILIPDSISIYPEWLPEGTNKETFKTKYQQISEALEETDAVLIDMTDIFMANKDNQLLYNMTDSRLTEYGSYLVYCEVSKYIEKLWPEAGPRSLSEFEAVTSDKAGGNLASYAGINTNIVREYLTRYTPKFDLSVIKGESTGDSITRYTKYADDGTQISTGTGTLAMREAYMSSRENLPNAIIYRDDNMVQATDILAERFNTVLFGVVDSFSIVIADAEKYNVDTKNTVDYIFVLTSEKSLDKILN